MNAKQILITNPYEVKYMDAEYSSPADHEVLVKMQKTTISNGTEKANYIGEEKVSIVKGDITPFPRRIGYSGAGTVIEVGKNVKKVKVGDRVACSWGSHQSIQTFPEKFIERVPDNVSFEDAAIVHIATFPLAAIRKLKLEIGESVLVMGLGILGMIAVKELLAAGAGCVIVADLNQERREMALKLGADYAFNPKDEDFAEQVKTVSNGGVKTCIEVTGAGIAFDMALDCMARYGRVALLGCTRDSNFTIDYYRKIHGPGIDVIGAHTKARPDVESSPNFWKLEDDKNAILELISRGRLKLSDMVCETHLPSEAEKIYKNLVSDKNFPVCVQFDWTKEEN